MCGGEYGEFQNGTSSTGITNVWVCPFLDDKCFEAITTGLPTCLIQCKIWFSIHIHVQINFNPSPLPQSPPFTPYLPSDRDTRVEVCTRFGPRAQGIGTHRGSGPGRVSGGHQEVSEPQEDCTDDVDNS